MADYYDCGFHTAPLLPLTGIGQRHRALANALLGAAPDRFRALEARVHAWAESRGIYAKGTPLAQAEKTVEEADELA